MAKELSIDAFPGITIPDAYLLVGEVRLRCLDETAEIVVYAYRNKEARLARIEGPFKTFTVMVHYPQYIEYFSPAALSTSDSNPTAAAYRLLSAYSEPLGMKELFEQARDV